MEQSHPPEFQGYTPGEIDDQVDTFVQCYEMEAPRVRAVLDRIMDSSWPGDDPGYILDEAVLELGPTRALEVFEREDLDALWQHVYIVDYLSRRIRPLYTLDELAKRTAAFIRHLESNRECLVRTGYPQTNFPLSSWHSALLGRLHCVKLPVKQDTSSTIEECLKASKRGEITRDERGFPLHHFTYTYEWAEETPPYGGQSVTLCPYEEAALIDKIDHNEAQWIERLRNKLYGLRVQVLQRLTQAAHDKKATGLWKGCLNLVTDSLLYDDAHKLLVLEREIAEPDIKWTNFVDEPFHDIYSISTQISGLTSLLTVIGHFEEELTIGRMHKTRECLTGAALSLRSYYSAIGQPWRKAVDKAFDCYMTLEKQELEQFWPEFRRRVNECLKTEFFQEVVICERVKRPMVDQFKSLAESHAAYIRQHLNTLGTLPVSEEMVSVPQTDSADKPDSFPKEPAYKKEVFEHSDDFRTIKFRGEPMLLTPTQSQIVEIMFCDHEKGITEINQTRILYEIGYESSRLRDLCRSTEGLWNGLIIQGSRRGWYRLNIFD